jgi:hypothetical protein
MSTPLAMLHPELLDPDDIQAISRDGLIMALNRKVDLLTRKWPRRHNPTLRHPVGNPLRMAETFAMQAYARRAEDRESQLGPLPDVVRRQCARRQHRPIQPPAV